MDLLKKVWLIETCTTTGESKSVSGGGICIDPSGVILTLARLVSFSGVEQKHCSISVRCCADNSKTFEVEVVKVSSQLELALLKVRREDTDSMQIEFMELADSVEVWFGEDIFGYAHDVFGYANRNRFAYSYRSGYTCFPLPKEVGLPDLIDKTTVFLCQSTGFVESCQRNDPDRSLFKKPTLDEDSYRTVGSVVRYNDTSLFDLHPLLPLVQVKGFDDIKSTSGFPLFRKSNKELIGLIGLSMSSYQFAIPVNVLRKYVDTYYSEVE